MKFKLTETTRKLKAKRLFLNPSASKYIKTFAILTGENPDSIKQSSKVNKELNKTNIEDVLKNTHVYYKITGSYGTIEHSYLIYNITLEDVKIISKNAHQQSFIFGTNDGEKLTFQFWANRSKTNYDYILVDEKSIFIVDENFEDFYSKIAKEFKFNIPFETFTVSNNDLVEFFDDRLNSCEDYKNNFDYNLSESLNDKYIPKGRDLFRIKLYSPDYIKFYKS